MTVIVCYHNIQICSRSSSTSHASVKDSPHISIDGAHVLSSLKAHHLDGELREHFGLCRWPIWDPRLNACERSSVISNIDTQYVDITTGPVNLLSVVSAKWSPWGHDCLHQ